MADLPSTGHLGESEAQRFPISGKDLAADTGDFTEFASTQVEAGFKIVALYPRWRATRARRVIQFARGALRSDFIAPMEVDASPLALSLVADQMAYLAPYLPSGLIAGLAHELPRHLLAGAWLRRVTKLATLPTSLGLHLTSYSPGSAFLALCAPEPQVIQVKSDDASAGIPLRPVEPVQVLLAAPPGIDTTPFDERLRPALRPASVRGLHPQPLAEEYFGTAKFLEFVALSAHPGALTQAVDNVRAVACAWCREPTAQPQCGFCGAMNHPPAGKPPAHPAAGQLPAAPQAAPDAASTAGGESDAPPPHLTMSPSGHYRSEPEQPSPPTAAAHAPPAPQWPVDPPTDSQQVPDPVPLPSYGAASGSPAPHRSPPGTETQSSAPVPPSPESGTR